MSEVISLINLKGGVGKTVMKKRKKKKAQVKYRAVMYCRVGTAEQLSPDDRKKEPLIVQKNKKALIS